MILNAPIQMVLEPVTEAEVKEMRRYHGLRPTSTLTSQHMPVGWVFKIEGFTEQLLCLAVFPEYASVLLIPASGFDSKRVDMEEQYTVMQQQYPRFLFHKRNAEVDPTRAKVSHIYGRLTFKAAKVEQAEVVPVAAVQ